MALNYRGICFITLAPGYNFRWTLQLVVHISITHFRVKTLHNAGTFAIKLFTVVSNTQNSRFESQSLPA